MPPPSPNHGTVFVNQPSVPSLRRHALSAFCLRPTNIRFNSQAQDEEIILLLRRHQITNVPWILLSSVLLIVPIMALLFLPSTALSYITSISSGLVAALVAIWYLFVSGFVLVNFFLWYFNVNIVTNRRILDIDFYYLLYREFSEALLSHIEEVDSTGGGLFDIVFDYGNVTVQTAAAVERIEFIKVPHPQEVVRIITSLLNQSEQPAP